MKEDPKDKKMMFLTDSFLRIFVGMSVTIHLWYHETRVQRAVMK